MTTPRYEFYETDERLTLSIFDKGADPAQVSVTIEPRKVRTRAIRCHFPYLTSYCTI
jgi:hypothetical protein